MFTLLNTRFITFFSLRQVNLVRQRRRQVAVLTVYLAFVDPFLVVQSH